MRNLVIFAVLAASTLVTGQQTPTAERPGVMITPPPTVQIKQAFEHKILVLDGLRCDDCSFKNLTLVYSGGAYSLNNATFSGTIVIVFHGAVQNGLDTVAALSSPPSEANPRKILRFDSPRTLSLRNTW